MNFLVRAGLSGLWFAASCVVGLFLGLLRWRDPSNGKAFGRLCSGGVLRLLGVRLRVSGAQRLESSQPCVYVANHQSYLDVLFFGSVYPRRTMVIGKKAIRWVPLFGLMYASFGNALIDRGRGRAIPAMKEVAERLKQEGLSVWMFPEGHRKGTRPMLPFKKGAFHLALDAGVPIVPIVLGAIPPVVDVARLRCPGGEIHLEVLDPIDTSTCSFESLEQLMAETRRRMERALDRI